MKNWLKNILVAGFLAVSGPLAAEPQNTEAPSHAHGVHGMILFGEPGRAFASHLPLYRHPHDWQVVLELAPADEPGQQQVNALLAAGGLLTLEPERFDLWRLKPGASAPLSQFQATLYRDHFERGGEKLQSLNWQVKRVWWFEPVRVDTETSTHRYFVIGGDSAGQTGWLLHKVERRPDVDQILRIKTNTGFTGLVSSERLLTGSSADARFQVEQVLWQDSDDLQ